jgi:2-aminoadipate transaminase
MVPPKTAVAGDCDGLRMAAWAREIKRSALQEMLSLTARPGILSFALGLPAAELFPAEALGHAAADVLAHDPRALQYGPPTREMKSHVVRLMTHRGVVCDEEQVFLTAGAQQGMNLLARLLLEQGGSVITEELTYPGFQQVIEPYQPRILTVPTNPQSGIDVDALESLLRGGARASFIYTVPEGHNPLGVSLGEDSRDRLVELANYYGVPLMEDDAYGFLQYGGGAAKPLRARDEKSVFYVGSFSKVLAPALRAGWLVVPRELIQKLTIVKEASDIDTATFSQRAIFAYLRAGRLASHLEKLRREYARRRDAMLGALSEHFPAGTRWNRPESGVFIWVELPAGIGAEELFRAGVEEEGVAFIPGSAFRVNAGPGAENALRLNFSNCAPEIIEDGVARLGRAAHRLRNSCRAPRGGFDERAKESM